MNRCVFQVISEKTKISISASGVYLEQKKFNLGGETTVNLEAIQASVIDINTDYEELVCYGKAQKQDIVSLFIRKEANKNMIVGRVSRVHVIFIN